MPRLKVIMDHSKQIQVLFLLTLIAYSNAFLTSNSISLVNNKATSDICTRYGNVEKFQITRDIVRLSEIDLQKCKDFKIIELFASEKVVIDTDWNFVGNETLVAIIAPIWEVIENRIINLSGVDGKAHEQLQAKNATEIGYIHGTNGLAGLPGSPAGNFYGVANEIVNGNGLSIIANGGNGGPGQIGGNGAKGYDGEHFVGEPSLDTDRHEHILKNSGWAYKIIDLDNSEDIADIRHAKGDALLKIFGKKGEQGGKGGNGGVGGKGGKGGIVIVEELKRDKSSKSVRISTDNGQKGIDGNGGNGGKSGDNGKTIDVTWRTYQPTPYVQMKYIPNEPKESSDEVKEGVELSINGNKGTSTRRQQLPKTPYIPQDFPTTVNEFKLFSRMQLAMLNNTPEKNLLSNFYDALYTNEQINKFYNTLSLVEEFTGLELQFFDLREKMSLTSTYDALKKRIYEYAETRFKKNDVDVMYNDVIRDLYRDIQSRTGNSTLNKRYPLQLNVLKGLENIIGQPMKELKERERIYYILNWLDIHKNNIDKDIEDAQNIIMVEVQNAINNLEDSLDQEIDSLLTEIQEIKQKSKNKLKALTENYNQLQNILKSKFFFGVLKVGFSALILAGPVSGLVGALASSGVDIIEKSVTNTLSETMKTMTAVPRNIQASITSVDKYFTDQNKIYENNWEKQKSIFTEMNKDATPEELEAIKDVWKLTEKERKSQNKKFNYKKLSFDTDLYNKIEDKYMTEWTNYVNNKKTDEKEKKRIQKGHDTVKYLKAASQFTQSGSDIAVSILNDKDKIDNINKQAFVLRTEIKQLAEFEKKIYNLTEPVIDIIQSVDTTGKQLQYMNENHLQLSKWNMTETIKTCKQLMDKVTKDFNVNEDLKYTFDKLISAFNLMIDLNSQILEYKKDKTKMNFITGLHIAHNSNLLFGNSVLASALAKLQVAFSYNSISESYDLWVSAFKQYSFPHAGLIFENFEWPDIFLNKNVTYVVHDIEYNVKRLNEYFQKPEIASIDKNKIRDEFMGSRSQNKQSFYIWKRNEFKNQITDVLSGKKRDLFANFKYPGALDALKFQRVEIILTTDSELQEDLDLLLNNFTVKLKHKGDNYYKCNDNAYQISNKPTSLYFGFSKQPNGFPIRRSKSYDMIARGDFILSPYATWSIKLTSENENDFKLLEKFKKKVDIELIGHGEYLKDSADNCNPTMDKYYTKKFALN